MLHALQVCPLFIWSSFRNNEADYFRVLNESMFTIMHISENLLQEKINESMTLSESEAKRDIMSILVRSRQADLQKGSNVYSMSDAAMVDQVVCVFSLL